MELNRYVGDVLGVERGILVHGCNCRGMMGSGIAGQIRKKWPDVYKFYEQKYIGQDNNLFLGDIQAIGSNNHNWGTSYIEYRHIDYVTPQLPTDLIVVNAMTQYDCGNDKDVLYVDYDAVSAAFARIKILARDTGMDVHFPLIGCGLANGQWAEVESRIKTQMGEYWENCNLWTLPEAK